MGGVSGGARGPGWVAAAAASAGSMRPELVSAGLAAAGALPERGPADPRRVPGPPGSVLEAISSGAQTCGLISTYFLYGSQSGRKYVAIELKPAYIALANKRLAQ